MGRQTVRISVEVRSGGARFRVGVQARNIREALRAVGGRYPQGVVRVAFPEQRVVILAMLLDQMHAQRPNYIGMIPFALGEIAA